MKKPVRTKCPTCGRQGDWLAGPYGPFCSHRCKLVDLGKWLGEEHAISQPLRPEHLKTGHDLAEGQESGEPKDEESGDGL